MTLLSIFAAFFQDFARDQAAAAGLSPAAQQDAQQLEAAVATVRTSRSNLDARLRAIALSSELSDEGKAEARRHEVNVWGRTTLEQLERTRTFAEQVIAHRESMLATRPLHLDPVLSESRLGNARNDLRMILDALPQGKVLERMQELAAGGDDMSFLLATSAWGDNYLSSRGQLAEVQPWQDARYELQRPYLVDDRARIGLDDILGLRDLAAAAVSSVEASYNDGAGRYGFQA